jgi:molybdopterin molybdotransferase
MNERLKLIPGGDARRILLDGAGPVGVEQVPLRQAVGRVLAKALPAPHDLPPYRLSAMDGYAARAADLTGATEASPARLRVTGAVPAGATFDGAVGAGQAVGIATGGVLPEGADAVVMVEFTANADPAAAPAAYVPVGGGLLVRKAVASGGNVVQAGEDVKAGVVLLSAGRRLRPGDLAALAGFGVVDVPVFRRPRIAVLATGSEICPAEATPRPGQVRDSNSYVLAAEVESTGCIAVPGGVVVDDAESLRATIARLLADADGLILSGGSSVGPRDLTGVVLAGLEPPGVLFHGIDIRPGKPTVFARAGRKPVVGMPGYPTSSMIVFEAFVRPLLVRMTGDAEPDAWPQAVPARLATPYTKPASREDYLRVRLQLRDGALWAEPLPGGSAAISNVIFADGLALMPAGVDSFEAGAVVAVRRLV